MANLHYSFFFFFLTLLIPQSSPFPLSTRSRWIVDDATAGRRVKLACVNLVSHLDAAVTEGLSKLPVDAIAADIVNQGFNCVRLTWPIYLVTNDSFGSVTVRQSFQRLGLTDSLAGVQANNPQIVDLTLVRAFQAVVSALGQGHVLVILDNHVTIPGWCCSNDDGNGFFNDRFFNPDLWVTGLTRMATLFKGNPNVVGMSLRNELRGPKQNVNDWYKYMQRGAEAVHSANPDVLVILSGLNYDTDLSFLDKKPVRLSFRNKLVFEMHWYGFSDGSAWVEGNLNNVCARIVGQKTKNGGFLLDKGYPLFLSEWGHDLRGTNENDNRYVNCFMAYAAEHDLDWALWTLQGSYYLRQGVMGMSETYGMLNWDWTELRNASFAQTILGLQPPFGGPGYEERKQYKVLYHPPTGKCITRGNTIMDPLKLGPCSQAEAWTYIDDILYEEGTMFCIEAGQLGKPVTLGMGEDCPTWLMASDTKMHLATTLKNSDLACLDVDSEMNIFAAACRCLNEETGCDPSSQWFKMVNSTRELRAARGPVMRFADLVMYYVGGIVGEFVLRIARMIEG